MFRACLLNFLHVLLCNTCIVWHRPKPAQMPCLLCLTPFPMPTSDVHGPASSRGPGQAGQSHGLPTALARLKILKSQSRQLRPQLLTGFFGMRWAYTRLSNNNLGIISLIIAIFRICPRRRPYQMLSVESYIAYLAHSVMFTNHTSHYRTAKWTYTMTS